jgi:hypothetical protein
MASLTSVQNKINTKIFGTKGLSSTVTRYPYNSQTTSKWGDATVTYGTSESIKAVPYSMIDKRTDFQPFGDVQEGETIMAFKHDQTLNEKDKIVFDGKNYFVREIEKFPFKDGWLVKTARLVESL